MEDIKKRPENNEEVVKDAAKTAERDISKDPDLQPDNSKSADLDEGELAKLDNSND